MVLTRATEIFCCADAKSVVKSMRACFDGFNACYKKSRFQITRATASTGIKAISLFPLLFGFYPSFLAFLGSLEPYEDSVCICAVRSNMSASVAPECNEVKDKYDTCFLKWYSESLSSRSIYA